MTRLDQLRQLMIKEEFQSFLITNPLHIRYFSSFTGTTAALLITLEKAYLFTDSRYFLQAQKECVLYTIVEIKETLFLTVASYLEKEQIEDVAFEEDDVTFSTFGLFQEYFPSDLTPVSGYLEQLRAVKEKGEIEKIKKAVHISDAAFSYLLSFIRPGLTERDIAIELAYFMAKKGASGPSFPTIVASGNRSALPHGVASLKQVEAGDILTLDFGCVYKGYVSDMTRTIFLGQPSDKWKEIYDVVLQANTAVSKKAKAGVTGKQLDQIARFIIEKAGYGAYFTHSLGHGIGLSIHEQPAIDGYATEPLQEYQVITNEPGIYLPHEGGVRIEDDLVIYTKKCEVLNQSSKEMIIL